MERQRIQRCGSLPMTKISRSALISSLADRLRRVLARLGRRALVIGFFSVWVMCVLLIVLDNRNSRAQAIAANLNTYDAATSAKAHEISSLFADLYVATRTISLLPAVRQVKPQNRRDKEENMVAEGRFNRFDANTVQQLYNHLASQISVSEIYLVYQGFDPRRGQVPFMAFDELILDTFKRNLKGEGIVWADTPEQDESSEYRYYARQLQEFQLHQPRIPNDAPMGIPGVFSELMRTCDNSQYTSRSQGSEQNAWGLTYTVPIFDNANGKISGLVATVILANTLEARLIGWPRLPILDSDKQVLRRLQVDLETPPVEYLLENASLGIRIYDRRNRAIPRYLANTLQPAAHLQKSVVAVSNGEWILHRWVANALPKEALSELTQALWWRLGGVSGLMLVLWLGVMRVFVEQRKHTEEERDRLIAIIEAAPDFIGMVDPDGKLLYVNQGGRTMSGLGDRVLNDLYIADLHPHWATELIRGRSIPTASRDGYWSGEVALLDGSNDHEIPVSLIILAHHDTQGTLRFFSMAMRDMSERKQAERQLQQINEDLEVRVAQRTESMQAAMKEAERANQAKSQFLASMSHELRTPMNAVLGFAQLMEVDASLSSDNRDNVKEIMTAGRHLLDLISEVLNLAKIESGNIKLSMAPVPLNEIIDECLVLVQTQAQAHGIHLEKADCAHTVLRADTVRLKQVLLNLLSNAIKYNRPDGCVKLHCTFDGMRARILVSDTGPGIPLNRIDEVFQPFNRLGAESGAIEGTGIGLTISRQLIELMGGSMGVESAVGVGSTFWFELPQERRQRARGAGQMPPTILCIEDNLHNLKQMSRLLGQRPHIHVQIAHTAGIGIQLASENRFDLILLDIELSEMDGFVVLNELRERNLINNTKVIAMIQSDAEKDIEIALAAGFNDTLILQSEAEPFLNTIDRYIPSRSEIKHEC